MSDLVWEDPPEMAGVVSRAEVHKYAATAAQLRARPRVWARVAEFGSQTKAGSFSSSVKQGRLGFLPKGAFESVVRTVERGRPGAQRVRVYVRYVGGESQ